MCNDGQLFGNKLPAVISKAYGCGEEQIFESMLVFVYRKRIMSRSLGLIEEQNLSRVLGGRAREL